MNVPQYIRKSDRSYKTPDILPILDKKLWVIVNHLHKIVFHKDGFLLLFTRKKDAEQWLDSNKKNNDWRIEKLNTFIYKE